VSPALRVKLLVLLAAVVAGGVVAGVVYATRQDAPQPKTQCKARPAPRLVPGVPSANVAAIRAAFAKPPKQAAESLDDLARTSPKDAVLQFNYGLELLCAGYFSEAEQALRQAKQAGRDTFYEISADNLLHPQYFTGGYPPFEYFGKDPLLVQGQIEQRAYHQRSAERLWAKAARLEPGNDAAQVAAAVGRFDMDDLNASFSRLGPLVKRFPRSQTVRYHLGLLLVWTGQRDLAITELRLARRLGPGTRLGNDAAKLLAGFVPNGTKGAQR
jgi:predicted Zn-dependent protease